MLAPMMIAAGLLALPGPAVKADVTGDGVPDIVTGAAPGGAPRVEVVDGKTGQTVRAFLAFDPTFLGGVSVAAGDVNGDGRADIVTGAGAGGAPQVKVFDGKTGETIRSWMAFDVAFHDGVRVAAGDVDGDGKADITVTAGARQGSAKAVVKVFSGADGAVLSVRMNGPARTRP